MKTFEDFLSDRCHSHTNNGPEGFERWLEDLDTQEVMDYAEDYGEYVYREGRIAEMERILATLKADKPEEQN